MAKATFDKTKPGTSAYWIDRLGSILDNRAKTGQRRPTMKMYRDYYEGEHRLAFATEKFRQVFGNLFSEYNENICGVVVNTLVERLNVLGLRMGNARNNDDLAWRIWQANGLDSQMPVGFREAATCGEVNLLVGPHPTDATIPQITVEDPLETVVVVSGRRRVVALKRWYDAELGRWRAFVYYPDRIEKFWGPVISDANIEVSGAGVAWQQQDDEPQLEHRLGTVPMIPMPHRPNLAGVGRSELTEVVPIQDAINKLAADMIVASEFGAFRQRWATGIEIPVGDNGQPVETFTAAIDRLWIGNPSDDSPEGTEARFGEFEQTSLGGYIAAIKQRLQMAATITRMPPHYLLGEPGQLPSGESLTAAETGLVAKAIDCTRDYDDQIEEAFRVGFKVIGDKTRAAILDSQVIWRDARFRTESEHIDALVKERALGIPDEILWEKVPYTPQEITRIKRARLEAAREMAAAFDPSAPAADTPLTDEQLESRIVNLGVLIRAGFTAQSAADFLGIKELEHTGRLPVTVQVS